MARIGIDLFNEFGYELPASFYHVHLAPIYRDHVFEERALRFDPRDIEHKRSWDAILHAGKVFAIQMKVQSIASKYGFTYQHGCGCNSHLSSIDVSSGAFEYELSPEKRQRWIRSFIWTAWYEYAFFAIVPKYELFSLIPICKKNATNRPFVETRLIASLPKDVLQSLIELNEQRE